MKEFTFTLANQDDWILELSSTGLKAEMVASDFNWIRTVSSGNLSELKDRIGAQGSESLEQAIERLIAAGNYDGITEAVHSLGKVEYSRIDALWDF